MTWEAARQKSFPVVALAVAFTVGVLSLGYVLLGWLATFVFAFGYVLGLLVWLMTSNETNFRRIRAPYLMTLLLFVAHKLEERQLEFFPALSQITGVPAPENGTTLGTLLYALAGAWLLIPFLVGRRHHFGEYLAMTFFFAMGVAELAHFAFPLFRGGGYGYFPGMLTVVFLAPAAWWGLMRLFKP